MRILTLAWEWPPHVSGGLGVTAAGLARALARRGERVSVLVPPGVVPLNLAARSRFETDGVELIPAELVVARSEGDALSTSTAGGPVFASSGERLVAGAAGGHGVTGGAGGGSTCRTDGDARSDSVRALGARATSSYGPITRAEIEFFARAALRVARTEPFDLIHAHDWMSYPAARVASAATGIPWIAHLHSLAIDRTGGVEEAVDQAEEEVERDGLQAADLVLCVSRAGARDALARYDLEPSRLRVLNGAVDAPRYDSSARTAPIARLHLLYLGRFEHQKGVGLLLAAATELLAAGFDFELTMIGTGSQLEPLRAYLRRVHEAADASGPDLAARIRFPGPLPVDEARAALATADLVVMPSRREPFGLVALEAARAGRCVLIPDTAGVRDCLPSAPTFRAGEAASLRDELARLMRDSAERVRLAALLEAEARPHEWDARARELEREARALLDSGTAVIEG